MLVAAAPVTLTRTSVPEVSNIQSQPATSSTVCEYIVTPRWVSVPLSFLNVPYMTYDAIFAPVSCTAVTVAWIVYAVSLAVAYVVNVVTVASVVATVAGSTTPTAYTRALVGSNVALVANVGSTTTGDSYYGIDGSSAATTSTLPVRVIDVVPDTATGTANVAATTYYEFIVKFNTNQYNNTEGI